MLVFENKSDSGFCTAAISASQIRGTLREGAQCKYMKIARFLSGYFLLHCAGRSMTMRSGVAEFFSRKISVTTDNKKTTLSDGLLFYYFIILLFLDFNLSEHLN